MRTLTYVLKRKDEASKVLSFLPGANDVNGEGQDLAGFVSPYFEDGQVLLYREDSLLFDSFKVERPFFELNVLVKGLLEAKAIFLVDVKGQKIKEITASVSSIGPKKGEPEKSPEEKLKEFMDVLLKEDCLYLSIDLSSKINRDHLDELKTSFFGYPLPVLFFGDKKKRQASFHEPQRHQRPITPADPFKLKAFVLREWPTACFLALFPLIGSLSLIISGALMAQGEASIGGLLLALSLFVYAMHVYITQTLFKSYPTRNGLLATTIASIGASVIGAIVSILLSLALSSIIEVEPFVDLMPYSYLGIVIVAVSSVVVATWAYIKHGLPSIFTKKGKH